MAKRNQPDAWMAEPTSIFGADEVTGDNELNILVLHLGLVCEILRLCSTNLIMDIHNILKHVK